MDYTVIVTNNRSIDIAAIELEEEVKEHIKDGWRPLGGACVSSTKYSGFYEHFMTQTMIKEHTSEIPL